MFELSFNFALLSLKASLFYTQIDFECLKYYLSKLFIYLMLCLYSLIISEILTIKTDRL